jgi:hypothetical protein
MRWFRFYEESLDNMKVQSLPPDLFKFWINILCVTSRCDGTLPVTSHCDKFLSHCDKPASHCDEIAFYLRMNPDDVAEKLKLLISKGLIDEGKEYRPHNWNKRQYKSDTSTERTRKYREKLKHKCDVTGTPQPQINVTSQELPQRTDTESETENNKDLSTTSNSHIHSLARDFFALFAADGFYIDKVNGNQQTVDMVHAWIAAGVTLEEAKTVIAQTKAKRGNRPSSPTYYCDIVLDAKRAGIVVVDKTFQEKIKTLFHEILPEYPVNVWTEKAAQDLQARIEAKYEKFDFKKLKTWRNFFLIVKCSTHIKKHEWHLDYLIQEKNFANILNNKRQVDVEQYEKLKQQYDGSPEVSPEELN